MDVLDAGLKVRWEVDEDCCGGFEAEKVGLGICVFLFCVGLLEDSAVFPYCDRKTVAVFDGLGCSRCDFEQMRLNDLDGDVAGIEFLLR